MTAVAKGELFATSDVVTLHLKLSDRTRGVVGADELAAMQRTAYLVNTSRGPLIDEDALIEALETGAIAGAGLDVFDVEPLPANAPVAQAAKHRPDATRGLRDDGDLPAVVAAGSREHPQLGSG